MCKIRQMRATSVAVILSFHTHFHQDKALSTIFLTLMHKKDWLQVGLNVLEFLCWPRVIDLQIAYSRLCLFFCW